jgi:hypothetical protein
MKTFDQQVLSDHERGQYGDCMRACVYTLLGEDIDLPHPIAEGGGWNHEFFDVLEQRTSKNLDYYPRAKPHWPDFVIRAGVSPRGIRHAVVWCRSSGTIVHDPHPSRLGLSTFDGWYVLK